MKLGKNKITKNQVRIIIFFESIKYKYNYLAIIINYR